MFKQNAKVRLLPRQVRGKDNMVNVGSDFIRIFMSVKVLSIYKHLNPEHMESLAPDLQFQHY